MKTRLLEIGEAESEDIFRALSSPTRIKILQMLAERDMNLAEIGQALGIVHPGVSKHIQTLEQAGLVTSDYRPGAQGTQKRCRLRYNRLLFALESQETSPDLIETVEMPVGLYTLVNPTPTCGLVSREKVIGLSDHPQSFLLPERAEAQLLWMAEGFVEYVFPNQVAASVEIHRLEVMMEVCSEAPDFAIDYPSDITVWVNGVEVGTWTSPGDFGGKRGRLNPPWWNDYGTQYGSLKTWAVTSEGSWVDGMPVSNTTLRDVMVLPHQPVTVRIGIKPDALHIGGFNLFGQGFGNHEQGLALRLHYTASPRYQESRQQQASLLKAESG